MARLESPDTPLALLAPPRHDRARWGTFWAIAGLLSAWLIVKPGGQTAAAWAGVIGNLLGPLIGLYWWASRATGATSNAQPGRRRHIAWLLLGLSILAFLAGQLIFYYYDRILGLSPFPSPADPFFVAAYPLQMAAVLLLPVTAPGERGRSTLRTTRAVLDGLVTVAAVATFSWFFLLGPLMTQTSLSPAAKTLLTAYPVMDLAILFCLVLLAGCGRGGANLRPATGVPALALGLLALVVADTVFAYQNLHGTYVTGSLNDVTWPLGYMLLGLGAGRIRRAAAHAGEGRSDPADSAADDALNQATAAPFWHALLPYAFLPGVAGLLAYVHWEDWNNPAHDGVEIAGTLIIVLVLIRQVLALADNARLNRQLRLALADREAGDRSLAEANRTLRESEQRFRLACQSTGDLVYEWTLDTRRLEWFGDVDGRLGYAPGAYPRTIDAWEQSLHPDDRDRVWDLLQRHLIDGVPFAIEYRVIAKDGRVLTWFERGTAIRDESGRAVRMIGAIGDITLRKLAEQKLRHDSLHDALTGLPNRVLFVDRVEQCVRRARRAMPAGYHFAVLFLDLDRFKVINDSLGHAAGDKLLVEVSRRLQASLRGYDAVSRDVKSGGVDSGDPSAVIDNDAAVARLGGDEFTILLDGLHDPADALRIAERIQADLARPIDFEGHELVTSASVGIVHGASHYESAKDLLRDADAAMYRAKQSGRARHAVFDASIHAEAVERLRMENDLRYAVARNELFLQYQPVVQLETGAVVGFEALLRWRRAGRILPPAAFVHVAEDTGVIVPIGRWVLGEACRQLAQWRARHPERAANLSVSVNLARKQLADPSLAGDCRRAIEGHDLRADRLILEVTESVIMQDRTTTAAALRELKRLGVGLHIDDFGTGYSSLNCLHELPLDALKIDTRFAQPANELSVENGMIVNAIIQLAHNLGKGVIAEGVESTAQLALLQSLGCDACQGHLFAEPLDPEEAERLLASTPPGKALRRLSA